MTHKPDSHVGRSVWNRAGWVVGALLALTLALAACQPTAPAEPAAAPTEAPAAEPTEAPAEEPTAAPAEEPTAAPMEEATEVPAEEPTEAPMEEATEAPMEEATATPVAEEEATATPVAEEEGAAGNAELGAYLFNVARGCGCHFNRDAGALVGGNKFELPDGVVYSANITPHPTTGIGGLSVAEIATILQTGAGPGGYQLSPVMPYRDYAALSNEDALNLAAYLFTLDPVENAVPPRELTADPAPFTPDPAPAAMSPTEPVARGEMLVKLARCGQCHTPKNEDGSPNLEMNLAGNRVSDDEVAWNLTPDEATGIGALTEEEIATFLRTGELSDGSKVAGMMGTQIERYFSALTEDDALAIAAYLKSLPPIENDPQ